jgi:hypothetical protein
MRREGERGAQTRVGGAGGEGGWGGREGVPGMGKGREERGECRNQKAKRVRSLHLWCCSLACFGTVVLCWAMFVWAWASWRRDHVAQFGFHSFP